MVKRVLSFVVSVSVFSGLFSGVSGTGSCLAKTCFFSRSNNIERCINTENEYGGENFYYGSGLTEASKYNKYQEKEEKKSKKSSESRLGKFLKYAVSFTLNMLVAKKIQAIADQTGLTDSSEFSVRIGNLQKILKKLPNLKKFSVALAKDSQAVKDVLNVPFYSSIFSTVFSLLGKGMSLFGLPDIGYYFGAVFGAKMALTNKKTLTETLFQNAANYLDDGDEDESKDISSAKVSKIKNSNPAAERRF